MRTVINSQNGKQIPVTTNLDVKPLIYQKKPIINGNGRLIMDDEWIYVKLEGYGSISINVNRADFCQKMYLSNVTIQSSIGEKKIMSNNLKQFVEKISDKLVFEYKGIWYRIFLHKKTSRTFCIHSIRPYKYIYRPNLIVNGNFGYKVNTPLSFFEIY